jgi:hypothetical protein
MIRLALAVVLHFRRISLKYRAWVKLLSSGIGGGYMLRHTFSRTSEHASSSELTSVDLNSACAAHDKGHHVLPPLWVALLFLLSDLSPWMQSRCRTAFACLAELPVRGGPVCVLLPGSGHQNVPIEGTRHWSSGV